jgi:hypothetical protein
MEPRQLVGITLLAVGGTLFLDSAEYVMRIAFITSENIEWFSFGSYTAFISLLTVGLGLYFLFEPAVAPTRKTPA